MRVKDDEKVNKIYRAAVKVINRDGFEGSSMAKIATEADVAPATIYLYFDNKEDMIKKLFIHLKSRMGSSYHNNISEFTPSKGTYRALWLNHYQFITDNIDEFNFLENFSNCPLINKIENGHKLDYCSSIESFFEQSKNIGLIQNLTSDLLYGLLFSPVNYMVKKSTSTNNQLDTSVLIDTFEASWRAISK